MPNPLVQPSFSLRTLILIICVGIGCTFLVYYLMFQARHIIEGPVITLTEEPQDTVSTSTINLSGSTENIISLTLNGRTIYTNDRGDFTETLVLPLGYTVVTLTAEDQYGRTRSIERTYVRTADQLTSHS